MIGFWNNLLISTWDCQCSPTHPPTHTHTIYIHNIHTHTPIIHKHTHTHIHIYPHKHTHPHNTPTQCIHPHTPTHTHTHTHTRHTHTHDTTQCWGLHALLQGNSWPALDKLLNLGQALAGALTIPSSYGVGTLQSHLSLSGVQHSQWSCPSPG